MRKIQTTKDYRLFNLDLHNRKLDAKKFRRLRKSIQEHGGLLPEWPIVCRRDEKAKLWVIDGHHRLYLAEELGYPVHYVIRDAKAAAVDVAMINSAQRPWGIRDGVRLELLPAPLRGADQPLGTDWPDNN